MVDGQPNHPKRPHAEIDESVGFRLQQTRLSLGVTHAELAAKSEVSEIEIASFEHGASRPEPETLLKIAQALGVPLSRLFPEI